MTEWAEGSLANVEAPNPELAEVGYSNAAVLPAAEFNWLMREALRARPRGYDSVADGIDATDDGDMFAVSANGVPGEVEDGESAGAAFSLLITDGLRLYAAVDDDVYALDPRDWSVLWSASVPYDVTAMCVDHGMLFVGVAGIAEQAKVVRLNPASGAVVATYTGGVDDDAVPVAIAANGSYVAYVTNENYLARILAASDLSDSAVYNHGAVLKAVAMDFGRIFVAGAPGVGGSGAGKTLVSLTFDASYSGGVTWTTPSWVQLLADGSYLFAIIRGGDGYSYKFGRLYLEALWSELERDFNVSEMAMPASQDTENLVLIGGGIARRVFCVSKLDGTIRWLSSETGFDAVATDGSMVHAVRTDGSTIIERLGHQPRTRLFSRTPYGAELV